MASPIIPLHGQSQFIFAGLIAVHLVLHWLSGKIERRQRLAIVYIFVQVILLFYMSLIAHFPILLLLLLPLLAEIVVIFEALWLVPIVLALAFALVAIGQLILYGGFYYSSADSPSPVIWIIQSTISAQWGLSIPLATCILLVRSRRQTGALVLQLDAAQRQLAQYADQIEQLSVTVERAKMTSELHETLAQGVAGLILQLEALDSQFGRQENERVAVTLVQIKNRARATLKCSRQLTDDLWLMSSRSGTILNSITDEIRNFSISTGIRCTLSIPPSLTLPTSTSEHAIRFVNEGLANIAKHAVASNVNVRVRLYEHETLFEIQDDGVGFDPSAVLQGRGHYGLLDLQTRAQLVGGKIEYESVPGKGTILRFYVPKCN
jgi:NarL family two-component system sensor histidine kinase YdfH